MYGPLHVATPYIHTLSSSPTFLCHLVSDYVPLLPLSYFRFRSIPSLYNVIFIRISFSVSFDEMPSHHVGKRPSSLMASKFPIMINCGCAPTCL